MGLNKSIFRIHLRRSAAYAGKREFKGSEAANKRLWRQVSIAQEFHPWPGRETRSVGGYETEQRLFIKKHRSWMVRSRLRLGIC